MAKGSVILGLALACFLTGCGKSGSAKSGAKESPAKVEKHPSESDIYFVTLTPKAAERLGISTAPVERKNVQKHRTFAGEVAIPPGNAIIVSAPIPGTLDVPQDKTIPPPGTRVEAGQAIFSLLPLLSPERDIPTRAERAQMANARASLASAQIIADGDMKQARAEVDAAQLALARAEQLLRDKAGSARAVDEARAAVELARKKLEAAQSRKEVLDTLTLDSETGTVEAIPITAPDHGILRSLSASRGQTVTMGAPLFEIANLDTVWIRVPVYVGQNDQVDTKAPAIIGELKGSSASSPRTATPIAAPPSADALASTVDLFYEIPNSDGHLRPGERIGVTLPLRGEAESLTAPWAAVLHDINGTQWVYEKVEDHVFRRRRVHVRYTVGELAVLSSGPDVGTQIVVNGAAELFGTEFGAGH